MNRRKNFISCDLKNNTAIDTSKILTPQFESNIPINKVISFPKNPSTKRTYDFSKYYGQGFDEITNAVQQTIAIMLSESTIEVSTISYYCTHGFKSFSDYLVIYYAANRMRITDINHPWSQPYAGNEHKIGNSYNMFCLASCFDEYILRQGCF